MKCIRKKTHHLLIQTVAYSIYFKIHNLFTICSFFKTIRIIFLSSLNSVYLCMCVYIKIQASLLVQMCML